MLNLCAIPSVLHCEAVRFRGAVLLRLRGEVRFDTAKLKAACSRIAAQRAPLTIVDLSKITFMSSLGMEILVSLGQTVRSHGGTLRLLGARPPVWNAFKRAGLHEVFTNCSTREEALAR
jgi:anti-anti-sigma factor